MTVEARDLTGKNAARQLRARGLVPAVFYGPSTSPAGIAVSPKELIAALSTPHGRNAVITLNVAGKPELAMVQDLQIHPVTRKPLHVDFYRV
ncbi:MAG TPA: 50S ribosomal protein L25, partial [Polyangiales bacterium]|nr:50S ribosomal protein L25 [Polyangiales bacterium]